MKKIITLVVGTTILLVSCKKDKIEVRSLGSLLVVNAAINIPTARIYAAENTIYWKSVPFSDVMGFANSGFQAVFAGNNIIRAVSAADTTISLFSSTKAESFTEGGSNTLFLCGNTGAYEGIFISNDNIINRTDSVMGVRFINLSPNSGPLNITLSTTPTVNEATAIAYKQKTDFKTYPALQSTAAMIFQVRDAANALLTSYTLPVTPASPYTTVGIPFARFKNLTLVVKGSQGTTTGTNALGIFPVAHY